MSCKRLHDQIECEPIVKQRLDSNLLANDCKQLLVKGSVAANGETDGAVGAQTNDRTTVIDDNCDTDLDMIMPYVERFRETYESCLSIYSSRLRKHELSASIKNSNAMFKWAIDNYQKRHQTFVRNTRLDMSGVYNVREEFECLLAGNRGQSGGQLASSDSDAVGDQTAATAGTACLDEKSAKVMAMMRELESKICADAKQVCVEYQKQLEVLVMIEYRLAIIIEIYEHRTGVDPQQFLPSFPYMQSVPDLIGYINSLYDEQQEVDMRPDSSDQRLQAIVSQFLAMEARVRLAMDGLHALSYIVIEKKREVGGKIHAVNVNARQVFGSRPASRDHLCGCL